MRAGGLATVLVGAACCCLAITASAIAAEKTYFSNGSFGNVSGYAVSDSGSLTELTASPFGLGITFPFGFVPNPDAQHGVAFGSAGGGPGMSRLLGLSISSIGTVAPAQSALTGAADWIAVSPNGRFAYAAAEPGGVAAYAIGANGALSPIGGSVGPTGVFQLVLTPDGKYLYGVHTDGTASIQRYAVQADGSVTFLGSTPAGHAEAEGATSTPDGRFLFVATDEYPSPGGSVVGFSIGADGNLTPTGADGSLGDSPSPYIPVVSPDGRSLYQPDPNLDGVWVFSIGPSGALVPVSANLTLADTRAAGVTPDGRFIYLATGNAPNEVRGFALNGDGSLGGQVASLSTPGGDTSVTSLPAQPPTAALKTTAAAPGSPSKFDGRGSSDADGKVARFDWNFGDGTALANGGPTPSHTYKSAGKFAVKLTVTDNENCSDHPVWAGFTAYCNGGPSAAKTVTLDTLPAISALSITNKRFAVVAARKHRVKRGTAFRYTLSESATVKFTVQRKTSGRKSGKNCKKKTKRNARKKKCTLYASKGSLFAKGKSGKNSTRFSGKLRHKKLAPGSYRAVAVATDSAKGNSAPKTVSFRIVR